MMFSSSLLTCRDLLVPSDLSPTTLEEKRQQWLEATPYLSLAGRKEEDGGGRRRKEQVELTSFLQPRQSSSQHSLGVS